MKRRHFLASAIAAVASGGTALPNLRAAPEPNAGDRSSASEALPRTVAGMSLEELKDDYGDRLFNQYLPFWERGGCDKQLGGFMCELNDDGSVASKEVLEG